MGEIKELAYNGPTGAWRQYETNGVPASGPHLPHKVAEIRPLFDKLDFAYQSSLSSVLEPVGDLRTTGNIFNPAETVDATPMLNAMIAAGQSNGFGRWFVPPGFYVFKTVPNFIENIAAAFSITGYQKNAVSWLKAFPSETGTDEAILRIRMSGVDIVDMQFVSLPQSKNGIGVASGSLVYWKAKGAPGPASLGYSHMVRCTLSSSATSPDAHHAYTLVYDGDPVGLAGGIRALTCQDVLLFGASGGSLLIQNSTGLTMQNCGTFTAGGLTAKIIIQSGSGLTSDSLRLDFEKISDGITTSNISGALITAGVWEGGDIAHSPTTSKGVITMGYRKNCTINANNPRSCFHIGGLDGFPLEQFPGIILQRQILGTPGVTDGFVRMADNGFKEQFMQRTPISAGFNTITFPEPFVNGVLGVFPTALGGTSGITFAIGTPTLTNVQLVASAAIAAGAYIQAVGF